MATVNIKDFAEPKIVRLVDLSEDSINKIAEAVVQKIVDAEPVKHGHWIEVQRLHEKDHTAICECSLCGDTVWVYDGQRAWNYCPCCGAKMDEVEDGTN